MTFETFDQSDEGTWPDQQKYNDKDKYKNNDNTGAAIRDYTAELYLKPTKRIKQTLGLIFMGKWEDEFLATLVLGLVLESSSSTLHPCQWVGR